MVKQLVIAAIGGGFVGGIVGVWFSMQWYRKAMDIAKKSLRRHEEYSLRYRIWTYEDGTYDASFDAGETWHRFRFDEQFRFLGYERLAHPPPDLRPHPVSLPD